jgi:phosphohistidine phosphatase SixA
MEHPPMNGLVSRRSVLGGAAAAACLGSLAGAQVPAPGTTPAPQEPAAPATPRAPRTFVLVRHGEKNTDDPKDPTLSQAGLDRAAALVRLLGDTHFTQAFSSEFKRTRDFAAPLCQKHGLTLETVPGRDLDGLVQRLRALPEGSTALVVGHSNTIPALAKKLGAGLSNLVKGTDLRDDEYDRCVVIAAGRETDPPALLELRY